MTTPASRRSGLPEEERTPPEPTADLVRPSAGQRRTWFMVQLAGDRPVHHVAVTLAWPGAVDEHVLAACLTEVVRRHEVLRGRFAVEAGELVLRIAGPARVTVPVTVLAAESEVAAAAVRECSAPFDLGSAPLLRARVLRVPGSADTVAVTIHHIAADGWSMGVFARELTTLYAAFAGGEPSPLPHPVVQYADFAAWQQDLTIDDDLEFWAESLRDAPPATTIPPDHERPRQPRHHGRSTRLDLDPALLARLRDVAAEQRVTLFMVVFAAFAVTLSRHAGTADVVVGTAAAGRDLPGTADLIGFFVNTVVLRVDLGGEPTGVEVLRRVRSTCLDAYAHQDAPFDRVVEHLGPHRGPGATPFFQVVFTHQNNDPVGGISMRGVDLGTSEFDLTVIFDESPTGACLLFEYDTDLYRHDTVTGFADDCEDVLEQLTTRPHEVLGLTPRIRPPERAPVPPPPGPPASGSARELAAAIAAIWTEVLGATGIGVADSFFDLGGNSLKLVEVRSRMRAALGLNPSLVDLYAYPTPGGLAAHLAGDTPEAPAAVERGNLRAAVIRRREER
ncbi:condensation domain-containing protein [Saccharothrix deserti]|uniref:condensation domain-containing protein n=1 Tax=Saccharothrix deserti TaxID=2593674 RepID=UPI00131A790B|nr:condensation domain-containing protein [Saccharothrix deserti]